MHMHVDHIHAEGKRERQVISLPGEGLLQAAIIAS
jgi:hypothetical protein